MGITLVCAFAGIKPLATYKDTSLDVITTQAGKVAEFLKETGPTQENVTSIVAEVEPAVVRVEVEDGMGSGMVIDRSGYILTCNHVVEDVQSATVTFISGEQYGGSVIGRDELRDLAILKITGSDVHVPIVTLGNSDKLEVGDDVIGMGYALGLEGRSTVSKGIISAFRNDEGVDYVQTDAVLNPGNSGGPLINLERQVIGIVSAKVVHEAVEGMGFAITINDAKPFITEVRETEEAQNKIETPELEILTRVN